MTSGDPGGRRRAREAALQMLYQSEVGRASAYEAIATYWPAHDADGELTDALREFANALVRGTLDRITEIDAILASHAQNWRIERMAVILQASLLVRHSPAEVADAFCATRLAGDWGHTFGTLPTGVDTAAIIGRAAPA